MGINLEGAKDLLGLWVGESEGAKFWPNVLTELKIRGVRDIFVACVDGLKGFPDAIESLYPETQVQLCMVHMVRNSLRSLSWKERKVIATDLKMIYTTNAIESINATLRKVTRKRGAFPNPESVRKVLYLAIRKVSARWSRPIRDRAAALNHFTILFEGR